MRGLLCSTFSLLRGPWKTIKPRGLLPGALHSLDSSGLMSEQRGRRSAGVWTIWGVHVPHPGWDLRSLLTWRKEKLKTLSLFVFCGLSRCKDSFPRVREEKRAGKGCKGKGLFFLPRLKSRLQPPLACKKKRKKLQQQVEGDPVPCCEITAALAYSDANTPIYTNNYGSV